MKLCMFAMPMLSSGINMCFSVALTGVNVPLEIRASEMGWKVGRVVSEEMYL